VPETRPLETLTATDFRDNLGGRFLLMAGAPGSGPAVSFEVELVEVSEHQPGAPGTHRTPFSLLFHGPLTPVLPQAIYRLEHKEIGGLELFIVPVGPAESATPGQAPAAMRYEVVFG
jgi:Domain of unknown function (DUF6916)